MSKKLTMDDAVESILAEEAGILSTSMKVDSPISGSIPCPNATLNKSQKIPENIKKLLRNDRKNTVWNDNEEDEESLVKTDNKCRMMILRYLTINDGELSTSDIKQLGLKYSIPKNVLMKAVQDLVNKRELAYDRYERKYVKRGQVMESTEEDDFASPEDFSEDNPLEDDVIDYFENSTAGSVSGIRLSQAVKELSSDLGKTKQEITECIKKLLKDGTLKNGIVAGTIMLDSTEDDFDSLDGEGDDLDIPEGEEDEEYSYGNGNPTPLVNGETPETLKAKGWNEVTPGVFVGPDGNQKFVITDESTQNLLNKHMKYKDNSFEALCEEFSDDYNEIEGVEPEVNGDDVDDLDDTDGLDEFEDEDDLDIDAAGDDITITLTQDEFDTLQAILDKARGDAAAEEDLDDIDDEDDYVDDAATDEEANADLLGDDDADFEDEDEDADFEDEDDDMDLEEDEESVADSGSSVYDSSFGDGAPSLKRQTPSYGSLRRSPIEGAYRPRRGAVHDGAGRAGSPSLSRNTPSYKERSGRVVDSGVTRAARSRKSIFDI
jgi:hypothetical protein